MVKKLVAVKLPYIAHMKPAVVTRRRKAKRNAVCSEFISINLHTTAAKPGGSKQ
uniref:Single-stranded DNA-binding protein n=1 Tax=Loa loa TaxID=7209 RepID=A0A1I7W4M6_LOALO